MTAPDARHALCSGRVWHVRRTPFRHGFDYGVHMLMLDLDALDDAFSAHRLWSLDRSNVGSFRSEDHLGGSARGETLAARTRGFVRERLGFEPRGAIRLLANPRYLGFGFNPVTFHFCQDPDGPEGTLEAIVLEVSNTPWNERHVYVLDCRGRSGPYAFEFDKDFHVSPFLPMDMRYRFRFAFDGPQVEIVKQNLQGDACVFAARMALEQAPLTSRALTRALLGVPMTFKVVGAIYWQALRLWAKGARYHPHPVAESR